MKLIIRSSDRQPIYEQIADQLRRQIVSGALPPGEALPSIRGLAKDLKISVITTKRAYEQLEAEGAIHTVAGKGCFVAELNVPLIRARQRSEMEQHLAAAVDLADSCGISQEEVIRILRQMMEE